MSESIPEAECCSGPIFERKNGRTGGTRLFDSSITYQEYQEVRE